MPGFTFFHEFGSNLGNGTIDLDSHAFKWALSNTAPVPATGTVLADIVQLAAGNGYPAGGVTVPSVTWAETAANSGIWRFGAGDSVITAAGGSIGPFRYLVLYDDTPAGDPLVGFLDYGSSITLTDGNTFTVDVTPTGIFTLTVP
jgi:hypothetical protein